MPNVKSVLFVGQFDIIEELAALCADLGVSLRVAFGSRQRAAWEQVAKRSPATRAILEDAIEASTFDDVCERAGIDDSWLVLSMGSPFIFRRRHIDLVGGKLINSHGAPLPEYGGGGGMSWRIMNGDRRGVVLLHQVTEGIDEGDVLARQDFDFPEDLRHPQQFLDFQHPLITRVTIDLVRRIVHDGRLPAGMPQTGNSTYYPRLATAVHGAIDWRWEHRDIERFVNAFAAPNPGSFTECSGARVVVSSAEVIDWTPVRPHPFLAGLIVAQGQGTWIVAAPGGYLRLELAATNGITLRLGDRLHTPAALIERAMSTRVDILPGGMRERPAQGGS